MCTPTDERVMPAAVTVDENAVKYLANLPDLLEIQQSAGNEAELL